MASLEMVRAIIEYHDGVTTRLWDSIDQIIDEQFLAEDAYSRGSIRNLMVNLAHTDHNWLNALKNLPDLRCELKKYDEFRDRDSVHIYWDAVAKDVTQYVTHLSESELDVHPNKFSGSRWKVLVLVVNHGTDHRSTILRKLAEFGAPTFDQNFISWSWSRK